MPCDHKWKLLDDIYAYKCSLCLEVRKHPTDKDDCSGHKWKMLSDGSGVYKCKKCCKLSAGPHWVS